MAVSLSARVDPWALKLKHFLPVLMLGIGGVVGTTTGMGIAAANAAPPKAVSGFTAPCHSTAVLAPQKGGPILP
jgi:hypothetical protein